MADNDFQNNEQPSVNKTNTNQNRTSIWPLVLLFAIVIGIASIGAIKGGKVTSPLATSGDGVSRNEVESIIRDYIKNNPEDIESAIESMYEKRAADKMKLAKKNVSAKAKELYEDSSSPVLGNPNGDVTLVEFFDYACGFCKRSLPAIQKLIEDDKNLRIVMKEFPILSVNSETSARAALAVHRVAPEKYQDFHAALMSGRFSSKDQLLAKAEEIGLDRASVDTEMESPEVADILRKNQLLADALGINGTPAFVIGEQVIPGALSVDALKLLIKEAREKK